MMSDTPEDKTPEKEPPKEELKGGDAPDVSLPNGETPDSVGEGLDGLDVNLDDILDPLSNLRAECDALKDQALRSAAEAENTRRRAERDVAQARKYGHTAFARDLLAVVENLSRALESLPQEREALDATVKNLVVGLEMVSRELETVLTRHGITRIMPLGAKFDPSQHQAMFEVPTDEAEAGHIVQVAQSGWMLHDRLLTPAMVGVAKALDGEKGEKTDENSE